MDLEVRVRQVITEMEQAAGMVDIREQDLSDQVARVDQFQELAVGHTLTELVIEMEIRTDMAITATALQIIMGVQAGSSRTIINELIMRARLRVLMLDIV